MSDKIIGIIPARMAASRFPGKPMKKINGIPMLMHVYLRAKLFKGWDNLSVAGCDKQIHDYCYEKKLPYISTSKKHNRCLDRVFEASNKIFKNKNKLKKNDIIVCVQGDEPMLGPDMISAVIKAIKKNKKAGSIVLGMYINDKKQFYDPNVVKIINNQKNEVLYTSRSPIPYCKIFSSKVKAKRIYGIFAFRYSFLKKFNATKESFLEKIESCDSNRICDNFGGQYVANHPYRISIAVDTSRDLNLVQKLIKKDKFYKRYSKILKH
jgi:3-deoxy-manno-octulosonate cytidylyltransferase (CMP-KDO synthetase)